MAAICSHHINIRELASATKTVLLNPPYWIDERFVLNGIDDGWRFGIFSPFSFHVRNKSFSKRWYFKSIHFYKPFWKVSVITGALVFTFGGNASKSLQQCEHPHVLIKKVLFCYAITPKRAHTNNRSPWWKRRLGPQHRRSLFFPGSGPQHSRALNSCPMPWCGEAGGMAGLRFVLLQSSGTICPVRADGTAEGFGVGL